MLIVDDSKAMRGFLRHLAQTLSLDTREAVDGQDALDTLAETNNFDLALVDWDMPVMNGLELVKNVRTNPSYNELKIMMVTSQTGMDHVMEALQSGANDYLMKPVDQGMLEEKLRLLGFEN